MALCQALPNISIDGPISKPHPPNPNPPTMASPEPIISVFLIYQCFYDVFLSWRWLHVVLVHKLKPHIRSFLFYINCLRNRKRSTNKTPNSPQREDIWRWVVCYAGGNSDENRRPLSGWGGLDFHTCSPCHHPHPSFNFSWLMSDNNSRYYDCHLLRRAFLHIGLFISNQQLA